MSGGFGAGPFGSCPWGVCAFPALAPGSAGVLAIAENEIQVQFTGPVYLSNLLDAKDASIPSKWTLTPVPGTVGLDGNPCRPVKVVEVVADTRFPTVNGFPTTLDIVTDRPMTAWPAAYTLGIVNVWDATQTLVIDPSTSILVPSVFKGVQPPVLQPTPARDIANPQTLSAMLDPLPVPSNPLNLGVFGVDDTGDYAFDSGLVSYKKRIIRRLFTLPNAFVFLPGYGVGLAAQAKKLARPALLQHLASEAEKQIAREPETEGVTVTATMDPSNNGLLRFNVAAVAKGINKSVRLSVRVPFAA